MYRFRILPTARLLQMPFVNNLYNRSSRLINMTPACALVVSSKKDLCYSKPLSKSTSSSNLNVPVEFFGRILKKSNFFNPKKYKLILLGCNLYENLVDTLDYQEFYKEFKMPDTFYAWFLVTELHIWMLMLRCMAEPKDGVVLRNNMVKAMWEDMKNRSKLLETKEEKVVMKYVNMQLKELSEQFNACIIAYDEGITGNDRVLSSAIWRRMLGSKCNDPEKVELLVHYVRKQVSLIEELSWEDFSKVRIDWKGLSLVNSK